MESLSDPITPVMAILARVPRQHIMQQYVLENFEDASEFLALLARSQGKLKKGGIPDREAAARTVLNDWNSGRLVLIDLGDSGYLHDLWDFWHKVRHVSMNIIDFSYRYIWDF